MSATDTAKPDTAPARRWRPALVAVLLAGAAVAVTGYAARKAIAREALMNWLRSQGVESEVAFRAFDADGAAGSLRIGPARDPDLVADVAEIEYDILGFWDGRPLGLRVTRVRLLEPSLKGRWHDGKLSLGALDPLIETLRKRPPQPDRGQPKIEIDAAHLRLATDYGPVSAIADLRANDGKLQRLDARIDPAVLKTPQADLALGASELHLVAYGNRLALAAAGRVERLKTSSLVLDGSNLTLAAQAPYPDLKGRSAVGALTANLTADTKALVQGGRRLSDVRQTVTFRGSLSGPIERLVLKGAADTSLAAAAASLSGALVEGVQVRAQAPDFAWTHAATDQVGGTLHVTAAADRMASGRDLVLTRIAGVFDGPAAASAKTWRLDLTGGASAHGAWSGLGPARPGDTPGDAALKQAAAGFLLDAQRLIVRAAADKLALALDSPVRLTPDAGGQVQVLAANGPLYADGAGSFRLVSEGGGLPRAELSVARYRLDRDGVRGDARLAAKGSLGPVVDGSVDVAGGFRLTQGALEVVADRCAPVTAERLELGANDVLQISGELCPQGGALFRLGDGGWRLRGEARRFAAQVPFLEARVDQAAGPIDLAARGGDLNLTADVRSARLTDTAKATRFRPVLAHGTARLADQVWRGAFDLTDPAGRALAHAGLDHDGRTGLGALHVDTGDVVFAEGGLQPSALSPLAAAVGSPAQGQARFQGAVTWTGSDSASEGMLDVQRLDFRSAAGVVQGLSGHVAFTSLVPLRAAPGQTLRAESITGLAPLKTAEVTFGLDHEAIQISGARLAVGGGQVDLKPFEIPFATGKSWTAVLELDGVQLSELVEASPFADRMDLEARVSGHIPVTVGPGGVHIADGEFHAISPGRISIRREALTQVSAAGGTPVAEGPAAPQVPADPYSDFAYQAMEHLAFTQLTAELASQPGGRLGVLFHIKGEHSPPTPQSIRLTWGEVIRRRIDRTLPLPSGTKVDLTLDTSLNLDQLLGEFAEFQGLKNSGSVQPR